uniref:Uncharacterized protein n=2 Tax=Rhizophora mucronata TaxID=61149 RepID=A0A2P2M4S9_RHIMU
MELQFHTMEIMASTENLIHIASYKRQTTKSEKLHLYHKLQMNIPRQASSVTPSLEGKGDPTPFCSLHFI